MTNIAGTHDANRLEASYQAVHPALLAADQRVHDLHAGQLGQHHERGPLDDRIADRPGDWNPGGAADFHAGLEALHESVW
jgi:hypothetical protein